MKYDPMSERKNN